VTTIARPQPLGVLALPAGWLVVPADALAADHPEAAGVAAARDRLLSGLLPDPWPAALAAHATAAGGDTDAAAALVDPAGGPEHAYNHFVLTGEPSSLELARAGADGDLAALVEVAAYALGHTDRLPDADALDGEVRAHVLAATAAAFLEQRDVQSALDALVAAEEAATPVSSVLGALLLGQQAGLLQEAQGADPDVVAAYVEAVDALRGMSAVEHALGELALGLGTAYHELAASREEGAGLLVEAVRCYHLALRILKAPDGRPQERPERYAFAHSNLALCYLAMPMTGDRDKLRRGVAVQSLREALKYYTREEHPAEWASVTLNLANAMQYLPTTHPVENLVEAVGLYDEVLAVRSADDDPLGYARVLANQGTALSHLGIHDRARERLDEARALFAAGGDSGALVTVDAALRDIEAALQGVGTQSSAASAASSVAGA
jgi:tetratricopeptide (TPR) repeat protein